MNPALNDLLGFEDRDLIGRSLDVIDDDPSSDVAERTGAVAGTPGTSDTRIRARRKGGTSIPVLMRASGVVGAGAVVVLTEITTADDELKRSEQRFARAFEAEREVVERLRAIDDMKNSFLSALSHELRTPVTAILGMARTVERELDRLKDNEVRELTRRISGKAAKLDRLLNDLLDLDRLRLGMIEPVRRSGNIADLVRHVVEELELPQRARIDLDLEDVLVAVDHPQAERIIENLVMNALTHTPPATPVWIKTASANGGVLLTVDDAGPGIPAELRETIFEPFRQGMPAQHRPGVGIGLSLVARFAEIHGGRAWVEESAKGGASFQVYLPNGPTTI